MSVSTTFDLLLRGGRVIDPASGLDGIKDVAIRNGKVAAVQSDILPTSAREIMSVRAFGKARFLRSSDPTKHGEDDGKAHHGGSPTILGGSISGEALARRIRHGSLLFAYLTSPVNHILVAAKLLQPARSAGMELVRADANLGTQAERLLRWENGGMSDQPGFVWEWTDQEPVGDCPEVLAEVDLFAPEVIQSKLPTRFLIAGVAEGGGDEAQDRCVGGTGEAYARGQPQIRGVVPEADSTNLFGQRKVFGLDDDLALGHDFEVRKNVQAVGEDVEFSSEHLIA